MRDLCINSLFVQNCIILIHLLICLLNFTVLHGMQTRSSDENSVKSVDCDKMEERSVQIFTALHGMQTRSSDENSVCPSVCLSHACIVTKR